VKSIAAATGILLMLTVSAAAAQGSEREGRSCLVEVLYSEELPIGPLFYHTVKVTLLVSAPHTRPFEMTIDKVIPWQAPPPRRGQRVKARCDPALLHSSFGAF
jgi:hypothetical protein